MIATILFCLFVVLLIETSFQISLSMRHASNRSANFIGAHSGGNNIDQHYGTGKIMPRLLLLVALGFSVYFTWDLGLSVTDTRSVFRGGVGIPEQPKDGHIAPEPKTQPRKPYAEDGEGMIVRYNQDYVQLADVTVAEEAGRPRNYKTPKQERESAEAPLNHGEVDMEQFRQEVPSGGSSYWLKTVTGNEMTVRKLRKTYSSQVDRVDYEWIPEQAFYRVYWGPFRSESEARTFRDRTPGCNCDIVPR